MPSVFEYHHTVAAGEIDVQGHANNVAYIQWMQDAAVAATRRPRAGTAPAIAAWVAGGWCGRTALNTASRPSFSSRS